MIYRAVREKYPAISLGTVYRNLSLMVDEGEILKLCVGEGVEHYDATTAQHYHFRCRMCGCVLDLKAVPMNHIDVLASDGFEGKIEGHSLLFYGLCPDCLKLSETFQQADANGDAADLKNL